MRQVFITSGNSSRHGAHHVAQKFTSRSSPSCSRRRLIPATVTFSSATVPSRSRPLGVARALVEPLTEQPIAGIFSTATGVPASTASMAFLASALSSPGEGCCRCGRDNAACAARRNKMAASRPTRASRSPASRRRRGTEVELTMLGTDLHVLERVAQVRVAISSSRTATALLGCIATKATPRVCSRSRAA